MSCSAPLTCTRWYWAWQNSVYVAISASAHAARPPAAGFLRSTLIAGGPHAIIWTHADEVNRAVLDFIGHPGQAG